MAGAATPVAPAAPLAGAGALGATGAAAGLGAAGDAAGVAPAGGLVSPPGAGKVGVLGAETGAADCGPAGVFVAGAPREPPTSESTTGVAPGAAPGTGAAAGVAPGLGAVAPAPPAPVAPPAPGMGGSTRPGGIGGDAFAGSLLYSSITSCIARAIGTPTLPFSLSTQRAGAFNAASCCRSSDEIVSRSAWMGRTASRSASSERTIA